MDQSIHAVDIMRWLMGEVDTVTSYAGIHNHNIDTEDLPLSVISSPKRRLSRLSSTTCALPLAFRPIYSFTLWRVN